MVFMLPRWHPNGQYQDQDTVWIIIPEVGVLQEVQKLSISISEVYLAILRNDDICTSIKCVDCLDSYKVSMIIILIAWHIMTGWSRNLNKDTTKITHNVYHFFLII